LLEDLALAGGIDRAEPWRALDPALDPGFLSGSWMCMNSTPIEPQ